MDDSATEQDHRSLWTMIREGYEGLVMTVIRPLRANYRREDLGPTRLIIGGVATQRTDLQLKNEAGYTLECSWWKPTAAASDSEPRPCIVVLHGNSSCRLGAFEIVGHAIPAGFSVFALDFCGSGLSEGKYVSLGYHEQNDIRAVVQHLREKEHVKTVVLWGRSMGAVATLLFAQSDPDQVQAMVLDSPFSNLKQLATELVEDGKLGVPKVAVRLVMRLIRRDIKRRAKFDLFKLKPIERINKCTVPGFFIVGMQDELVGPHHVVSLYKSHNGPNQIFKFSGGHNSPRPLHLFKEVLQFVRVMVGLLPLSPDEPASEAKSAAKSWSSSNGGASQHCEYANPLEPGVSIDQVHRMTVRELKQAIDRAGYSDVTCIEKQDLVQLVLRLYARYRQNLKPGEGEDGVYEYVGLDEYEAKAFGQKLSPAAKKPLSSSSRKGKGSSPQLSAKSSVASVSSTSSSNSSSKLFRRHSSELSDAKKSEKNSTSDKVIFPPSKASSSVISDAEITEEFKTHEILSD